MNWIADTLWDLLGIDPGREQPTMRQRDAQATPSAPASSAVVIRDGGARDIAHRPGREPSARSDPRPSAAPVPDAVVSRVQAPASRLTMSARYDALVREMKSTYGIRVRKWRNSSSGCAWEVHYRDGSTRRLVESPYPRGPMSCAIFLHEIGHHAIGFGRYRPRCLEEYQAWKWAIEAMEARGFNVTAAVRRRMTESLRYAVSKARRRGLRRIPAELHAFLG